MHEKIKNIYNNDNNENSKKLLNYLLEKNIKYKKSKEKISDHDLVILKLCDYNSLININYNLNQLKRITKYHNIKVTGNKKN